MVDLRSLKMSEWNVSQVQKSIFLAVFETKLKSNNMEEIILAAAEFKSNAKLPVCRLSDLGSKSDELIEGWSVQCLFDTRAFIAIGEVLGSIVLGANQKFSIAELMQNECSISLRLRSYFKSIHGVHQSVVKLPCC